MENVRVYDGHAELAEGVALRTATILKHAVIEHDSAVWILAGGSTPLLAYSIISSKYSKSLDWRKVTIVMGDERMGSANSPNNNWHTISQILNNLPTRNLKPNSNLSAEESADDYESKILELPKQHNGLVRFDLIWLGVGSDGHTLSLFPTHSGLAPTRKLVIPIHNSPKPPNDRISLSLRALSGVDSAMIIANGKDKKSALCLVLSGAQLPITLATKIIETHNGQVEWLLDKAASPESLY